MLGRSIQMLSGADSVRGAEAFRLAVQGRRDSWPYVHIYPPPNAIDVFQVSTLAVPSAASGETQVLRYQVNAGKRFYLQAVILGANVTIIPGDALFTLDRNSAIGVVNSQFMPEHGLVNINCQLGSTSQGSFRLERAREFAPLDIIRIKATNVNLSEGGSNFYVCGIFGYEIPTLDVKPSR